MKMNTMKYEHTVYSDIWVKVVLVRVGAASAEKLCGVWFKLILSIAI